MNHSEIVSFLWGVADLIRDTFKRGKYQDVILPLAREAHKQAGLPLPVWRDGETVLIAPEEIETGRQSRRMLDVPIVEVP